MQLSVNLIATKGGDLMEMWFGIVSIILSMGFVICFLALLGYKFHGAYSKEKIEVSTEDSNLNEQQRRG